MSALYVDPSCDHRRAAAELLPAAARIDARKPLPAEPPAADDGVIDLLSSDDEGAAQAAEEAAEETDEEASCVFAAACPALL